MAVVGEARIVVRAITTGVSEQISSSLRKASAETNKVGDQIGKDLNNSIKKSVSGKSPFGSLAKDALKARDAFSNLQRSGFFMQSAMGSLAGTVGALVGALGGLVGALGAAAPAMVAVGGAGIGLGLGMKLASMALKGTTGPLSAVNKAAGGTGKTIKQLREEMQQLRFEAEDAALGEKDAALGLEKARNNLARMADLPPNTMARREAELEFQKADLAYRKAKDRNKDLQDQINNPQKKGSGSGVDPYAGLTKSQKAFAKLLVGLKPQFDSLKEAVAKGFLPKLGDLITQVMTRNFPTLHKGLGQIGTALGSVATNMGVAFDKADKSGNLGSLFATSAKVIESFGGTLNHLFGALLTILKAASPITEKFVKWIEKGSEKFEAFIDTASGNGSLKKFFEDSAVFAKKFGDIFGNIFKGFGALISDAFKPGSGASIMLDWLKKATDGFGNMGKDKGLHDFLAGAATNTTKMLDVLGGLFKIIKDMGADPNIGIMWDTLGKGLPIVKKILEDGAKSGPAMAELFYQVTRVLGAFSDNKTLEIFFKTLSDAAKVAADFFNNPDVKKFMDSLSQVHGFLLAVGLGLLVAKKAGLILFGTLLKLLGPFKYFFWVGKDGTTKFVTQMGQMKASVGKLKEGIIKSKDAMVAFGKKSFAAVKSAGSAFAQWGKDIGLYVVEKSKAAGAAISSFGKKSAAAFKSGLSTMAGWGKSLATNVIGGLKKAATAVAGLTAKIALNTWAVMKNVGQWIAQKVALVASTIAQTAMRVATVIATGVQAAFNFVMALNPITLIIIGIVALIAALAVFFTQTEIGKQIWQGFIDFMTGLWNGLIDFFTGLGPFFADLWNGIVNGIVAAWNWVVGGIRTAIDWVVGVFRTAWNGITGFFRGLVNGLIGMFEGFVNFVINGLNNFLRPLRDAINGILQTLGVDFQFNVIPNVRIPRLAKGGTVMPSAGGSLVNVAEAGRPERIEPLDKDGLSKRDKAMIAKLSGNGKGNVQITVNPSPGMDERELAAIISRRLAFEMRKGTV